MMSSMITEMITEMITGMITGMTRSRRLALLLVAVAATLGISSAAFAHSGLGAASPAPGSRVGGDITEIQLRYNRTVSDVSGSVTDPNGDELDTEFVQDGNLRVTIVLDAALSIPGEYAVRHISTDVADDDTIEAAYLFTYDPTAPPPTLEIVPDSGGFPWVWVILLGGLVVIAVLAWRLRRSLQQSRSLRAAASDA
jgi:methionine-rich copper-binding protein CopC